MLSACNPARENQPIPPLQWEPYIDQPIKQLEEILDELTQQQPMNYTISNIAFLYDAKLFILFHNYLATLPVEQKRGEIEEQRAWLEKRKEIVKEVYEAEGGGTLSPYIAGESSIETTKERLEAVREKIQKTSNKTMQPTRDRSKNPNK